MNLKEFKKEFDPLITNFINLKISEISHDTDLKFLVTSFNYLNEFISDGKRIRPYIAYLSYNSFGGKNKKETFQLLIFLELFHNFCLLHDDIMDNSSTRHGLPTIHKKFGISNSILIGDYLHSWSWETLCSFKTNNKILKNLQDLFSEMTSEVFLGQAIDINLDKKEKVSNEIVFKKTLLKTAGYTFIRPMLIGLLLSGKYSKINIELMEQLGKNLGLAFQIQDDLLDIKSDFDKKKKMLSDIAEGKHTLISNYVFENGNKTQKEYLKNNFGKEIKNPDEIKKIFAESGAVRYAEDMVNKYFNEAKKLANSHKDFLELINILEKRIS